VVTGECGGGFGLNNFGLTMAGYFFFAPKPLWALDLGWSFVVKKAIFF